MRWPIARFAATLCLLGAPLSAQPTIPKDVPPPERPALPVTADPNSATSYFTYGALRMDAKPDSAYAGFYWASRLDPTNAEAWYARALAINIAWVHYRSDEIERDPAYDVNPPEDLEYRFDTLMTYSLFRDPFVDHRFDLLIYRRGTRVALSRVHDDYLHGDYAYAMHDFPEAVAAWGKFLKSHPERLDVHVQRAQAWYHANEYDSAYAEFALVVARKEAKPATLDASKPATLLYESKALMLFSMGIIRARQYDWKGAREDFGRALGEDLSFYPAHTRIARVDLALHDTTAAESEFALAADLAKSDAVPHLEYATLLLALHKWDDACKHAAEAAALAPDWAAPYEALGRCEDGRGHAHEALALYQKFIAGGARSDTLMAGALAREKELASALARAGTPP